MATTRPFAYNPSQTPIIGTIQFGDIAIGVDQINYSLSPGGLEWWNGPDEDLGYVIAIPVPSDTQPTNIPGVSASIGFFRSGELTDQSFIEITNYIAGQTFINVTQSKNYLDSSGYWTNFILPTPTPTPTPSPTPTPTPTPSPTPTPTPSPTPSPTPTSTPASGVTFSQTFTSASSPGTTIENAWTTFRGQLTGAYTQFDFYSSNGQGYTGITDSIKVQQLATNLKNGTVTSVTISGVTWLVGCCACRAGGATPNAVEFSNVGSCNASSTAALRPWIANANWGGIGTTVNAATQTLTLRFY
jgi:hypothetical protein